VLVIAGWLYKYVAFTGTIYRDDQGVAFPDEQQMFLQLGASGWELVVVRQAEGGPIFYFKRPRS
jgi:hypothetical protein